MKRISILLLLFGIVLGLATQQPAPAFAATGGTMDMAAMSESDMASMPDCMAAMQKDATDTSCKCDMAGCVAMMASGMSMMLADGSTVIPSTVASERNERIGISAALRGRSTAPEPEPPQP